MSRSYDWDKIRLMYCTDSEIGFRELSRKLGGRPSHVSIMNRAKSEGWEKGSTLPADTRSLDICSGKAVQGSRLGLRTPENIAKLLNCIELTGDRAIAAALIGVHPDTLTRWTREDTELAAQIEARRAGTLVEATEHILAAGRRGDWRASQAWLAAQRETRATYGKDHSGGRVEISINIDRNEIAPDGLTIQGEIVDD